MIRILSVLFLAACMGCSPSTRKQRKPFSMPDYRRIQSEMRRVEGNFAGSGEIYFSSKEGRQSASFDARWNGDTLVVCTFYDPFGRTAASVTVEPNGSRIEADGKRYRLPDDKSVDLQGMFSGHAFTFRELIRILTGRLPTDDSISGEPDSLWREGELACAAWINSSWEILTVANRRTGRLASIVYHTKGKTWTVAFSEFRAGIPYLIKVHTDRNEEFVIAYKRIKPLVVKPPQGRA